MTERETTEQTGSSFLRELPGVGRLLDAYVRWREDRETQTRQREVWLIAAQALADYSKKKGNEPLASFSADETNEQKTVTVEDLLMSKQVSIIEIKGHRKNRFDRPYTYMLVHIDQTCYVIDLLRTNSESPDEKLSIVSLRELKTDTFQLQYIMNTFRGWSDDEDLAFAEEVHVVYTNTPQK